MPRTPWRYIGIVGSEAAKFTPETEYHAREIIRELLTPPRTVLVSGGCHLGGVDLFAEEIYTALRDGRPDPCIFKPAVLRWRGTPQRPGFRERNVSIARASHETHCITVAELPANFRGMCFLRCYHCNTTAHVKSGGCWTAKYAQQLGKAATWHTIHSNGDIT